MSDWGEVGAQVSRVGYNFRLLLARLAVLLRLLLARDANPMGLPALIVSATQPDQDSSRTTD